MTDAMELTCKEVVELVTDYLTASMPTAERARFEEHLATCPGCTTYLQQMQTTVELTGQVDEASLSDEAKQELLDTFRRWKKG
jgi:anti-sigma factor RsiW